MPKIVALLTENQWEVKRLLAERVRNELRKMPELLFFVDDSIEYAKKVDALFEKLKKSEDKLKGKREESSSEEADQ
jgi:ribosome-binding factor A